mgnify:FL=1
MTVKQLLDMLMMICMFMLLGWGVREIVKPLQKLFLPASLIGGLLMLAAGQQGLGIYEIPKVMGGVPGVLINVVMASLVFGVSFNKEKIHSYLDYICLPMPAFGMQMCIGTLLGALLRDIWPGLPLGWGVMGVFSFCSRCRRFL